MGIPNDAVAEGREDGHGCAENVVLRLRTEPAVWAGNNMSPRDI